MPHLTCMAQSVYSTLLLLQYGVVVQWAMQIYPAPPAQGQGPMQAPPRGESAPQCMYSFVVNELDTAKCPILLQEMQAARAVQNEQPEGANARASINKGMDRLSNRVQVLETKLYQEVAENRDLKAALLQQDREGQQAASTMKAQASNITNLMDAVRHLEIKFYKHKDYWQSIDNKLSGVMLDMVEVNNMLTRQVNNPQQKVADKFIPVQSAASMDRCATNQNVTKYKDCEELYHNGHTKSGVYYVMPIYTNCPVPVYCDMDTPPGGWLIFLRRLDGSTSFNHTWAKYRQGFGDTTHEYWLGNDNLFLLTNQLHYQLRVDLYDFYGSRVYAEYLHFRIDGERDRFRLYVSNHTGTAPDSLTQHDGAKFSTPDQDNDAWMDYHCGKEWSAGWWFNNCWYAFLTGAYYNTTDVKYRGISWNEWKTEQLKRVEMKIRPSGF